MKRMIFLMGFCCLVSMLEAQEFIIDRIRLATDTTHEVRVHVNDRELYYGKPEEDYILRFIKSSNAVEQMEGYNGWREKWLLDRKSAILTPALDTMLSDACLWNKTFDISIYFNGDGTVFTVYFVISDTIYKRLLPEWLKNTFNQLMKERIEASRLWDFSPAGESGFGRMDILVTDLKRGVITPQRDYVAERRIRAEQLEQVPQSYELNNEFY